MQRRVAEISTPGLSTKVLGLFLALAPLFLMLGSCVSSGLGSGRARQSLPRLHPDDILLGADISAGRDIAQIERGMKQEAHFAGRVSSETQCASQLRICWLKIQLHDIGGAHAALERARATGLLRGDIAQIAGLLEARLLGAEGAWSKAHARLHEVIAGPSSARMRRHIEQAKRDFEIPIDTGKQEQSVPLPSAPAKPARILPRTSWNCSPAKPERMTAMGRPRRLTIHHTAIFGPDSALASRKQIRAIQHEHQAREGWGDIGYHFLIDRGGRIYQGRQLRYQGAHAGDHLSNQQNIGICLLGNYHNRRVAAARPQRPTRAQLQSLLSLLRSLRSQYSIPVSGILTHREVHPKGPGATECPGDTLQAIIEWIRRSYRKAKTRG
ncbi:MAG: hypothetical protein CSA62_03845 [Planctomycetota bacterium]|nr:MAG: hypothetical protein CSA62_03845 [Planctomycetota bacterium]